MRAEVRDIVLLVDVSTSMRAEDLSSAGRTRDRLAAAKEVIERFIRRRGDDRIGLVAFSGLPYTVSPLTLDHGWLVAQLGRVETGMIEDGTAIGDGLAVTRTRHGMVRRFRVPMRPQIFGLRACHEPRGCPIESPEF